MSIKKLCTGSHTQPIMNIQRKGNNIGIPSLIFFSLICDSRLFTTIDKSCSSFPDSPLPSPSMLTYELLKFGKINGWYGIIPENDPAGRGRGGSDGLSAFCISVKFCKKKEYPSSLGVGQNIFAGVLKGLGGLPGPIFLKTFN